MPAPKKVGAPIPVVKRAAQWTRPLTAKRAEPSGAGGPQKSRLWLMYPPKLITNPVIWELAQKFPVVTNVRQASVTDEIGIVCLELEGQRPDIKAAIQWLEKTGIKVEPVEINVIES
jgi:L-aspartate semialdehyde sulfurtransferase ferredoxin